MAKAQGVVFQHLVPDHGVPSRAKTRVLGIVAQALDLLGPSLIRALLQMETSVIASSMKKAPYTHP